MTSSYSSVPRSGGRVLNDSGLSANQQVERAFRIVFSRGRKDEERQAVLNFLNQQAGVLAERLARNDKVPLRIACRKGMESGSRSRVRGLVQALMNSNEFHLHELVRGQKMIDGISSVGQAAG